MKDETNEDLLDYISFQEDHPKEARLAFEEFYRRHKDVVWAASFMLSKDVNRDGDPFLADTLLQDTFRKVFDTQKGKGTFSLTKAKNKDQAIKAWLFTIAKNTLKDYIKSTTNKQKAFISNSELMEDQHPLIDPENEATFHSLSVEMADLQAALSSLKEREQTIVRLTLQHLEEGGIPEWLRTSLCKEYGITGDNLRQIRSRALKKLLTFLAKQGYDVPSKKQLYETFS